MSYTALYREWRPRTFEEVVGQEHITRTLQNAIKAGRIGHAYLFCGIRGTGKTSTAKILAKALNCEHGPTPTPCDRCPKCTAINRGILMDVVEIDAASNRGIDEIRNLRDRIGYAPADGRYKVYIIDEVHMLTNEAFNALLKTLEEPPGFVVFILATTEPHKLPDTILSRCQRFDFKRLSTQCIYARLKKICEHNGYDAEDSALMEIAKNSDGAMRDAISVMDQCISYSGGNVRYDAVLEILGSAGRHVLWEFGESILKHDAAKAFGIIDDLAKKGKNLRRFAAELLVHFRNLMVYSASGGSSGIIDEAPETIEQIRAQSRRFSLPELVRIVKRLSELESDMRWSDHPRVLVEMCAVRLIDPKLDDSAEGLISRIEALERAAVQHHGPHAETEPTALNRVSREAGKERAVLNRVASKKDEEPAAHQNAVSCEPTVGSDPRQSPEPTRPQEDHAPRPDLSGIWTEIMAELNRTKKALFAMLQQAGAYPEFAGDDTIELVIPGKEVYMNMVEKDRPLLQKAFSEKLNRKVTVTFNGGEGEKKNLPAPEEPDPEDETRAMIEDAKKLFGEDKVIVLDGFVDKFLKKKN